MLKRLVVPLGVAIALSSGAVLAQQPIDLPGSNLCQDAPRIGLGSYAGTTAGLRREATSLCGSSSLAGDAWYRVDGSLPRLFAQTLTTGADTVLSVYDACPPLGQELICHDSSGFLGIDSFVSTPALGGDYFLRVSTARGSAGPFVLEVTTGGSLVGRVTAEGGAPLEDFEVVLYTYGGFLPRPRFITTARTDADGRFEVGDLETQRIGIWVPSQKGFLGKLWEDIPCPLSLDNCDFLNAPFVTVLAGETVAGFTFELTLGGAIEGRVTERSSGEPLAGIQVGQRGLTGEDGSYRIESLPEGSSTWATYSFGKYQDQIYRDIDCGDFCQASLGDQVSVSLGQTRRDIDFMLTRRGVVSGRARATGTGEALADVEVTLFDADSGESTLFIGKTDAEGRYLLGNVRAGNYFAVAGRNEIPSILVRQVYPEIDCRANSLGACDLNAGTVLELAAGVEVPDVDFSLSQGGVLKGRVADSRGGAPLQDITVQVYSDDDVPVLVSSARTDELGEFEVLALPGGRYKVLTSNARNHLDVAYPDRPCFPGIDCLEQELPTIAVAFEQEVGPIDLRLPPRSSIGGQIVDGAGSPVAGARVEVHRLDGPVFSSSAPSATDGSFIVDNLVPGLYRVSVSALGFVEEHFHDVSCALGADCEALATPVALGLAQDRRDINFALASGGIVRGTVQDPAAQPLAGRIRLRPVTGGNGVTFFSTGDFEIPGVAPGSYFLESEVPGRGALTWPGVPCPDDILSCPDGEPLQVTEGGTVVADFAPTGSLLTLNDDRFEVRVNWRSENDFGSAQAVPLTSDSGYFWFFGPDNVELIIKVLDACHDYGNFWVFTAGLTHVEVSISVVDRVTGAENLYRRELGPLFEPILDTEAFDCSGGQFEAPTLSMVKALSPSPSPEAVATELAKDFAALADKPGIEKVGAETAGVEGSCQTGFGEICLNQNRFRVNAQWRTPQGGQGGGVGQELTADTGYFWFFGPNNVEIVLKVLDACQGFGHFWVFAGGLTNVEVDLTVTDELTGRIWTHQNPLGETFSPVADTTAFSCDP